MSNNAYGKEYSENFYKICTNIRIEDIQWLAGVIDAEGCFDMKKRKSSKLYSLRIVTTDKIIVPKICRLLHKTWAIKKPSGEAKSDGYSITLSNIHCYIITKLIRPYLYTKAGQADCVIMAKEIKSGVSSKYSEQENAKWWGYYKRLKKLNATGKKRKCEIPLSHTFTWPWLAGFIDGDGSVHVATFKRKHGKPAVKPAMTISNSHIPTIKYIAKIIDKNDTNGGNRGNRSPHRKLRLLSNKLSEFGYDILPYLVLKKDALKLSLDIVELRESMPNGTNSGYKVEKVKELLSQLQALSI